MKWTNVVVVAGVAAVVLGALGSDAMSKQLPDQPTSTPCSTARDCPANQYCNPAALVCYWGVATSGGCNTDLDCPGPSYCHVHRCHVGNSPCTSNQDCVSTQYCHFGLCHAEACNSDGDCPLGVSCITFLQVCGLP